MAAIAFTPVPSVHSAVYFHCECGQICSRGVYSGNLTRPKCLRCHKVLLRRRRGHARVAVDAAWQVGASTRDVLRELYGLLEIPFPVGADTGELRFAAAAERKPNPWPEVLADINRNLEGHRDKT